MQELAKATTPEVVVGPLWVDIVLDLVGPPNDEAWVAAYNGLDLSGLVFAGIRSIQSSVRPDGTAGLVVSLEHGLSDPEAIAAVGIAIRLIDEASARLEKMLADGARLAEHLNHWWQSQQ
jgi:hypothetical protein